MLLTMKSEPKSKSYIGRKGYAIYKSEISQTEIDEIKKELTMTPFTIAGYGPPPESFEIFKETSKKLYLPRQYGIRRFGKPPINKLLDGVKIDVPFVGELREEQIVPTNICVEGIEKEGGGIFCIRCGGGKTVCSCKIISVTGRKTLIVVNKGFLAEQWRASIKQFLPSAKVGIIKQKNVKVDGMDIVIGMLQSLSMRDYDKKIFKDFGLIIFDEIHLTPSKVFSRVFQKTGCILRKFGCSATPSRIDKMDKVYKMYIGDILYLDLKNTLNSFVHLRKIYYKDTTNSEQYSKEILNFKGKPMLPLMINNITNHLHRTTLVVAEMVRLYNTGRSILGLSSRRKHLLQIKQILEEEYKIDNVGLYIGGMKQTDLDESATKRIILSTQTMCSTGFDVPKLNTLFLITPVASVNTLTQCCGRVLRKFDPEFPPIIADIVDDFSCFKRQSQKRDKYYKSCGYIMCNENYLPIEKSIDIVIDTEIEDEDKEVVSQDCLF